MTAQPIPNSRDVAATTPGISRDMQASLKQPEQLARDMPEQQQGGGNLNGSQNTAHMMGRAGTAADRLASPRRYQANYTGVI